MGNPRGLSAPGSTLGSMTVGVVSALDGPVSAVPTLADARRAADAISSLDPGLVLLHGSVAEGTADAESDVDLVVVFDDLGDYSQRSLLRRRAKEAAESAIGRRVDVRVTDRPEWRARTGCVSSFERHVASRAVTLRERRACDVDWHKEIPIPPTDAGMARASLDHLAQALEELTQCLAPYAQEDEAMESGDSARRGLSRSRRMRRMCASAQAAMETGLKALNHALPGPHPPRTHDLGALIDVLPVTSGERDRLAGAIEGLDLAAAAQWREMGTYPGDFEDEVVAERSTPAHAALMVHAAARLTLAVVDLIEDRLGSSDETADVRAELSRLTGARTGPEPIDDSQAPGAASSQVLPKLTSQDMTRRQR